MIAISPCLLIFSVNRNVSILPCVFSVTRTAFFTVSRYATRNHTTNSTIICPRISVISRKIKSVRKLFLPTGAPPHIISSRLTNASGYIEYEIPSVISAFVSSRCVRDSTGVMMCGISRITVNRSVEGTLSPHRLRIKTMTAVFAATARRFCSAMMI